MKEREGCRGSTIVEAAVLFPLIILLMIQGFSLMTMWYSQWEQQLENHGEERAGNRYSENLTLLHWEQWGELLEDEDG